MGYMNNIDIVLSEYKLSDAQKNAVVNIMSGGTEKIQLRTYTSLEKRGLIHTTPEGWVLDDSFHAELKAAYSQPEPREEQFAEWEKELVAEMPEEKAAVIREEMEDEFTESDEPAVPFFNRKARREFNRNIARYNRRLMRLQGKRARKYGAKNLIIRYIAA